LTEVFQALKLFLLIGLSTTEGGESTKEVRHTVEVSISGTDLSNDPVVELHHLIRQCPLQQKTFA
jgi:hypothetical protein